VSHLVDGFSQTLNPLFALALGVCAWKQLPRPLAYRWLARVLVAILLVEVLTKAVRHFHLVDKQFPSTHYVFALAIAGAFWALHRRFVPATLAFLAAYGILMLARSYHTPLDLVGALPALPLGFLAARGGTRRAEIQSE